MVNEPPEPDVGGEHLVLSGQFRVGRVKRVARGDRIKAASISQMYSSSQSIPCCSAR